MYERMQTADNDEEGLKIRSKLKIVICKDKNRLLDICHICKNNLELSTI